MATQSEIEMEVALVQQLVDQGYEFIPLSNELSLLENFKTQLEAHNKLQLTQDEFEQLVTKLNKGDVFDRSKRLKQKVDIQKANGDVIYLELFDSERWCQNRFQVARQITNKSEANHSRYDVTILINGLPLVQVELKARGSDIKSAFDQIVRYRNKSYSTNSGLFDYIQLFIISNGVDTRYFSNNKTLSYQFTFEWSDIENQKVNRLSEFTETFLERCHLSKMIARYIVQHETFHALMVLRPYQYYAVEKIIERVKHGRGDGYIWHTTGSGKTLTSFKTSQILSRDHHVDKVVFVVDRRDLDTQTKLEFNAFSPDSVDPTENTQRLVTQLTDPACGLIVTTIQKLNAAITKQQFKSASETVREQKFVFIFDECHRSQFGETHQRICDFFPNRQMFGFTGTPIFDQNVVDTKYGKRTTEHLFGKALHKYVITDAIRDRNVLRFSIEYRNRKQEESVENTETEKLEKNAEFFSSKDFLESTKRISSVVDDVIAIHPAKSYNEEYTGMFCVSSVDALQQYYALFKAKKEAGLHDLKVATIFSCAAGEPEEFSGVSEQDLPNMESKNLDSSRLAFLESCIADYNQMFGSSYSASDNKSFYRYYEDLAKRVKKKDVDILLVVNMFLTGFDSPPLNTLYVDKNLKHHGLIQAYSRTNRVYDAKKSHGNIVCYRDLKAATDEALSIFANRNAKSSVDEVIGTVIMAPYADLVDTFRVEVEKLKQIAPSIDAVDQFVDEEDQYDFIAKFRDVLRMQNTLKTFPEFQAEIETGELGVTDQDLLDYQSKYLDLKEDIEAAAKVAKKEKKEIKEEGEDYDTSEEDDKHKEFARILADIDFEIELIKRDEVTVGYILRLIEKLQEEKNPEHFEAHRDMILDTLQSNPELRSKRDLFEKFIDTEIDQFSLQAGGVKEGEIIKQFNQYVDSQKAEAMGNIAEEFGADLSGLTALYADFVYKDRLPDRKELIDILAIKPSITRRKVVGDEMRERIQSVAEIFEDAHFSSERGLS